MLYWYWYSSGGFDEHHNLNSDTNRKQVGYDGSTTECRTLDTTDGNTAVHKYRASVHAPTAGISAITNHQQRTANWIPKTTNDSEKLPGRELQI